MKVNVCAKKNQAVGFTGCPVLDCKAAPSPLFCPKHWPLVSSEVRRELVAALAKLRGKGVGDLPDELRELLLMAVEDVRRAGLTQPYRAAIGELLEREEPANDELIRGRPADDEPAGPKPAA